MGRVRKRNRTCIGLDPGQNLGYAVLSTDGNVVGLIDYGVFRLNKKNKNSYGKQIRILLDSLDNLFHKYNPDFVGYESIRFHKGNSACQVYGFIKAGIEDACEIFCVRCDSMVPSTIRKVVFSDGHAKKLYVRKELENLFDVKFNNTDESDAVACGIACMKKLGWIDG